MNNWNADNVKVGDKLWFEGRQRYHQSEYVTVVKVGRKWLMLSNRRRAHRDTLEVDGGDYSSPGKCWPSKEACEAESRLRSLWASFHRPLSGWCWMPDGMTEERIREAAKLLGVKLEEPQA